MSDGWGDGRGSRGPSGRCIRHAPEAAPRAVGPLAVPVIEPAFQAALMPRVRAAPLTALRGRTAVIPTVRLPPVAGPTDVEHRPAPRPAAPHRAPRRGSGHRPCTPRRRRMVRRRRGAAWETGRPAWEDGGARPGGRRSRTHGSRRLRDRTPSRPSGLARVCVNRTEQLGARRRVSYPVSDSMSCRPGTAFRPRRAGVCRPAAPGGASATHPEERQARRSVGGSPGRVSGFRPASAALLGNTSNVEFGIRRSVLSRRRSIAHAAAGADADATARAQLLLEVYGVELHGAVRLAISGAATCNVVETDTDYAERRANAEFDGPETISV